MEWLDSVVEHKVIKPGKQSGRNMKKRAQDFLLRWSFFGARVMHNLTLNNATSFGSFHLIRMLLDEYILLALETQFNNEKEQELQNLLDKYMKNADASKATFTASPSSCFLANRNKASTPTEQQVKNESLGGHAYMSMSTNQDQALEAKGVLYQGNDISGFTAAGGQTDFCQISGPLMTPPISPAALVHRSSVINQGPMAGRPLSSSSKCSSSSSCLSSLGVMTQPNACPSYPESLYHCSSYFPSDSSSSAPNNQTALRSQTLAPAQSQAASVSCHFPRHSSLNDQQLTKNMFYNHHSASVALSSNSTNCSLTPYSSSVRPASSYTPSSDSLQTEQALDPQTAAQILDSAAGFSFVGAGLNLAGGGCQAQAYSGHNGGFYGNNIYLDSHRMTSLVDQHVSVISSVGSLRPFPTTFSEVHDPLNILDEPGRKASGTFFSDTEAGAELSLPSSGSSPCMFGLSSPFTSQEALLSQQHMTASSEVQDLVSSLPPINTVFMGAGGVQ